MEGIDWFSCGCCLVLVVGTNVSSPSTVIVVAADFIFIGVGGGEGGDGVCDKRSDGGMVGNLVLNDGMQSVLCCHFRKGNLGKQRQPNLVA